MNYFVTYLFTKFIIQNFDSLLNLKVLIFLFMKQVYFKYNSNHFIIYFFGRDIGQML